MHMPDSMASTGLLRRLYAAASQPTAPSIAPTEPISTCAPDRYLPHGLGPVSRGAAGLQRRRWAARAPAERRDAVGGTGGAGRLRADGGRLRVCDLLRLVGAGGGHACARAGLARLCAGDARRGPAAAGAPARGALVRTGRLAVAGPGRLAAFAAIGGPVFLAGTPTWTSYTRIVDIAFQMDFAKYLAAAGRVAPPPDSSYHAMIAKVAATGYPSGGQATLGAMAALIRTDVPWCYQAYLAFAAAMGALAIFSLLGRITTSGPLRAVGAAVAIQPNILYGYALEGGIKEFTMATLLMVVAALLAERLPGEGPRRGVLPTAVALSAAFAAFSAGIAPWLGVVFAGLLAVTLAARGSPRRYVAECWALLGALSVLLSFPNILNGVKLASATGAAVSGVLELGLGNLAAPLPDWSGAGVWLTGDYRYPLVHVTATHAFDVLVIVLAVLGIFFALRRRRWAIGFLGLAAPIALYFWIEHTGPWVQLKAFTMTAAIALALAFAGAAALCELRYRPLKLLGWFAALLVAGAVLYGNAVIYHDTSLAPAARYQDLAAIGERYAGQGPTLFPALTSTPSTSCGTSVRPIWSTPRTDACLGAGVSSPGAGISFAWDLNQIAPSLVQSFR